MGALKFVWNRNINWSKAIIQIILPARYFYLVLMMVLISFINIGSVTSL